MSLKVNLVTNPKGLAKGAYDCEIRNQGMLLTKGKKDKIKIPVGSKVKYLGKNQLAVQLSEYELTVSIAKLSMYQEKFARDLVAFIKGEFSKPDPSEYSVPWYLFALSVLPIGIPVMTLGGAIPGMIGFGLMAACFSVAQLEKMSMVMRILIILAISIGGYAMFFGIAIASMKQQVML